MNRSISPCRSRVVTTFIKAAAFASDPANKDEVFDGWSLSGFPKDAFEGDIEADTLANRLNPLIDDFIIARYKDQVARAKAYGLIKGDVDVDAWLEPKYLQQALKDLKLVNYWSRARRQRRNRQARRSQQEAKQLNIIELACAKRRGRTFANEGVR